MITMEEVIFPIHEDTSLVSISCILDLCLHLHSTSGPCFLLPLLNAYQRSSIFCCLDSGSRLYYPWYTLWATSCFNLEAWTSQHLLHYHHFLEYGLYTHWTCGSWLSLLAYLTRQESHLFPKFRSLPHYHNIWLLGH